MKFSVLECLTNWIIVRQKPALLATCAKWGLFWVLLLSFTVELQCLENLWSHEIFLRHGLFELMSVNHSARSGGIIEIYFRFFLI